MLCNIKLITKFRLKISVSCCEILKQKGNLFKVKSNKSYLQLKLTIKYAILLKANKIKIFITLKVSPHKCIVNILKGTGIYQSVSFIFW